MKFGRTLQLARALPTQVHHCDKYLPYKAMKKMLKETEPNLPTQNAFVDVLLSEMCKLESYVSFCVDSLESAAKDVAKNGFARLSHLSVQVGAVLAFIEYNREGLRKIAKKFDKRRSVQPMPSCSEAYQSVQAIVLYHLDLADFCTSQPERLRSIQEQLLSSCNEEKRHLLEHAFKSAAAPDVFGSTQRAQVHMYLSTRTKLSRKRQRAEQHVATLGFHNPHVVSSPSRLRSSFADHETESSESSGDSMLAPRAGVTVRSAGCLLPGSCALSLASPSSTMVPLAV